MFDLDRIGLLGEHQQALSDCFAGAPVSPGREDFCGAAWRPGTTGLPILGQSLAWFECHNRSRYDEGDHVIFVGEVERCASREGAQPLIFHGGRYFTELPI